MMPASISHEGYSAADASYWDNFWSLRGYKDAVEVAEVLAGPMICRDSSRRATSSATT